MIIKPIIPLILMIIISIVCIIIIITTSKKIQMIIRIAIVVLLFIINLRPMVPNGNVEVQHNNLDMIFVLDTTLSMAAKDVNGAARIDAAKKDIEYIVKKIPGAKYSLITFDNQGRLTVPLTYDRNAFKAAIDSAYTIEETYAKGSQVTLFKEELEKNLETSQKKDDRERIVFILSDGENTSDKEEEKLTDLRNNIDNGIVLGYGTSEGSEIVIKYSYSDEEYTIKDRTNHYESAITKLDEENLNKIANDLKIDYIYSSDTKKLDKKIDEIKKMKKTSDKNFEESYQDIYYYVSPILIIMFIIEIIIDRRIKL